MTLLFPLSHLYRPFLLYTGPFASVYHYALTSSIKKHRTSSTLYQNHNAFYRIMAANTVLFTYTSALILARCCELSNKHGNEELKPPTS